MSKGSRPRPTRIPRETLALRWEYLKASKKRKEEILKELKKMEHET